MQLLVGFVIAAAIAYTAYRLGSLSSEGMLAAALMGAFTLGLGGWSWALLLLIFFTSSSLWTQAFKERKRSLLGKFSKGGRRDAAQVVGNGGVATAFVILHAFFPQAGWPWLGFAASLAAVNADTWATELGVLTSQPPRRITCPRQRVERGTSGGVTLWGTGAALLGSLVIALAAAPFAAAAPVSFALSVTLGGWLGSLLDSFLGASLQALYYCPSCRQETERHPFHTCGERTLHVRGWRGFGNDLVNMACALGGVAFGGVLFWLMG